MTEIFENIKKLYRFYSPTGELADFIEFFAESSAEQTYRHVADSRFTIKMFPSWTPTCYLNLGPPYQLTVGPNRYSIQSNTDVLILRNTIVERFNLPTDSIFTVKFYPGGLEAILGISQLSLIDKVVRLETVLPASLIQRVKRANQFDERIALLEQFFLNQYQLYKKDDHYRSFVADTIGTFEASGLVLSTSQLADRMFATSRTNRYFHRVVGTSPKHYLSQVRIRAALSNYVADKKVFFARTTATMT